MDILQKITQELKVSKWQVDAAVALIDEGNTIPFISRYRKEVTGSLDDEQLRNLDERLKYLRNLEEKKVQVLSSIEEQGKLTKELREKIEGAETLVVVEDLYRPFRPKRKTRASIAKEKGLEPLAEYILAQEADADPIARAAEFISEELGVPTAEDALQGAEDILAEMISDDADHRLYIRSATLEEGELVSSAKDSKAESVFEMYYDYREPVRKVAGHRVLALNRGEKEKILTVKLSAPTERILRYLEKQIITNQKTATSEILRKVAEDSYERLIAPAIEREIRNELTEKAEDGAISVFGKNLIQLLLAPPIGGKVVLGWDPAFRTGCKLAVVDATGKVLHTKVIYPTAPQNKVTEAKAELKRLIDKYHVELISLGNGTASRESEQIIVELIKELKKPLSYVIVNEAGASVYSASKLASDEFPHFDVGQRSAASIARRIQDPLAELVKIDPKSIGVGQYQHDMNQKKLSEALNGVVEDCVNKVGVDLNTASVSLLSYISGISKTLAKNIVDYRETNGRFGNRKQLLKVAKLGPKAFEQCAGFLRISDGDNPLDATSVHPESYDAAKKLLNHLGMTMADVRKAQNKAKMSQPMNQNKAGMNASAGNGTVTQRGNQQADTAAKTSQKSSTGQMKVNNMDTAMGRALAAAMGMSISKDQEDKKKTAGAGGNKNTATGSGKAAAGSGQTAAGSRNAATGSSKAAAGSGQTAAGSRNAATGSGKAAGDSGQTVNGNKQEQAVTGNRKSQLAVSGLERLIQNKSQLAIELGIGEITLTDILKELEKPARDPREDMPKPILRSDVLEMKDLKPGMILKGTVRNVIDFGVFVDIGVHQDGLVHISRITDRFIKHPLEAVSVGDIVDVQVLEVDAVKKRIGLTMRINEKQKQ
jgi:uncharacterized protein